MNMELALTLPRVLGGIEHGLRETFNMIWDTLWAMILGFGLSGIVQAFVSKEQMQSVLGDHRPKTIAKSSFYGMISSSCSYAASAMTKSLFLRGADFLAALVFMFASTNLVIELGIVLIVLIGWQFALAEFVGGAIMIVLVVIFGSLWLRGHIIDEARNNLEAFEENRTNGGTEDGSRRPTRERIRSLSGWSDAASYTMSDLTMLRREIIIGFLTAGFLTSLLPSAVWSAIFFHGHGFATTVENAIVGPFIAIISFVCSIGNVPLAAALWQGGISFGGVISFIFADLITLPLLLIYRKFYGGRLTIRMLAIFWASMSLAGLITEAIFHLVGAIPHVRPTVIAQNSFGINYTTALDFLFLIVFTGLYWLYRNRERFGGGSGYAKDVVCGMQVESSNAPATVSFEGTRYYFCSNRCSEQFTSNPKRYLTTQNSMDTSPSCHCHGDDSHQA